MTKFFFRNVLEQHRLADKAEVDKLLLSSWNYLKLVLIMSQDTIFKEFVTIKINILFTGGWKDSPIRLQAWKFCQPQTRGDLVLFCFCFYWSLGLLGLGWGMIDLVEHALVGLYGLRWFFLLKSRLWLFIGWGLHVLIKFSLFAGLPQQTTR